MKVFDILDNLINPERNDIKVSKPIKEFFEEHIKQTKCQCLGCESGEVCKKEIRIDIKPKQ